MSPTLPSAATRAPMPAPAPLSLRNLTQIVYTQRRLGQTDDQIVVFLVARGWPDVSARRFVNNALAGIDVQPVDDRHSRQRATPKPSPVAHGLSRLAHRLVALLRLAVAAIHTALNLIRF